MRGRWLVIGHGSVGAALTRRVLEAGGVVYVRDTQPRVPLPSTGPVQRLGGDAGADVDFVAVCVPAGAAPSAARYISRAVEGNPVVFDWTSSLPGAKRLIAGEGQGSWVDIALMDSLDGGSGRPLLAVSGEAAGRTRAALEALGFDVLVVGPQVGQAAAVKLVRSLFMKSLEVLVIEARAIGDSMDATGTAWLSVERSLGKEFSSFADLLVVSNAVHSERRGGEIREAIELARERGFLPVVANAAAAVFDELSRQWARVGPAPGAPVAELLDDILPVFRLPAAG